MLSPEWLQAFVPVGFAPGPNQWKATGGGVVFLEHDLLWLVTARHVVEETGQKRIAPLLTKADGSIVVVQLADMQASSGFSWLEDEQADVAVTPLPVMPGLAVKAVTHKECILVKDVIPSMPAFTLGCPYGLVGLDPEHPRPLVLDGVVSGTRPSENLIFTSTPTFPDNSGGPLVVFRNPCSAAGGLTVGQPVVLLAGVVLQMRLVSDPNLSGIPPLHLGVVRSADAILRLLLSDEAVSMAKRLR